MDKAPRDAAERVRDFLNSGGAPAMLGRYVLGREVGRGGAGIVYEAEDPELHRRVAVKVLDGERGPEAVQRLHREAAILAQLRHPNIVAVHEIGAGADASGRPIPFIAMEFVTGGTFADVLRHGRASRADLLALLADVAAGTGHAHSRGVVHRDLKPSNVLIETGPPRRVVLTDFGLARADAFRSTLTRTGAVMGTPNYMAPEQVEGRTREIDARTDVYALGAMLYEILTGRTPFTGATAAELFRRILWEDPVPPSTRDRGVPPDLETICLKSLEKDPSRRYPNAAAFGADLARHLRGEPIVARPPSVWHRLTRTLRRRRAAVAVAVVAALAAAFGIVAVPRIRRAEQRLSEAEQTVVAQLRELTDAYLDSALNRRRAGDVAGMLDYVPRFEKACRECAIKLPRSPEPHYRLGRMYRAAMRFDEAESAQDRALELDPGHPGARYERALLRVRRYEQRVRDVAEDERRQQLGESGAEFVIVDPARHGTGDAEARRLRDAALADADRAEGAAIAGIRAWLNGDRSRARAMFEEARAAEREREEAWEWGARCALEDGRHDDALADYTRGLERDRGYAPFLIGRAWTRWLMSQARGRVDAASLLQAAEDDATRAIELARGLGAAWECRAAVGHTRCTLLHEGGFDRVEALARAADDYREAASRDPSRPAPARGRAYALSLAAILGAERGGEDASAFEAARTACTDVVTRWPALPDARLARSRLLVVWANVAWKHGREATSLLESAIEDCDAVLAAQPDAAHARLQRGVSLHNLAVLAFARSEDPTRWCERALADLERAVAAAPSLVEARLYRAGVSETLAAHAASQGADPRPHMDAALADLDRFVEGMGRIAGAWMARARGRIRAAAYRLARGEDARALYQGAADDAGRAIEMAPGLSEGWALRAGALFYLGRTEEAVADADRALERNRADAEAWAWRAQALWRRAKAGPAKREDWDAVAASAAEAVRLNPQLRPHLEEAIRDAETNRVPK
jgi:serine/threonine-protein kinase